MPLPAAVRCAAVALALGASACESGGPEMFTPAPKPSADFPDIRYATWTNAEPPYRLYPGDEVDLAIPSAPELNKTLTVQPDGRLNLALAGPVMVADRTIEDSERLISNAYAAQLLRPAVSLTVRAAPLKVFVGGEVDKAGVYDMPGDINALQAIVMAGDFKPSARRSQVVIIRRGPDGRAMLRTVDLRRGVGDPAVDLVPLRRFDIVYVPRSTVSEAGLFVQQYFRDLTPVQLGFQYAAGGALLTGVN
ncbi:MAG TPA: polysaccharide biosynthesis/export family protein [Caulobacteraceae bacterium]|jgi:polysaccharide export outer membrane protein|nr:polysaccharide biosynthesis/export family protein [Caulobacteraceae bacterium]